MRKMKNKTTMRELARVCLDAKQDLHFAICVVVAAVQTNQVFIFRQLLCNDCIATQI